MKFKQWGIVALLLAGMGACSIPVRAQDAVSEPQFVNQVFIQGDGGNLIPLERQPQHHAFKRKNIPFIKAGVEGRQDVDGGPASPVHVGPNTHFIVRLASGGQIDPATLIHLVQLKVDKQGRYYVTGGSSGYVFTNGKSTGPQGDAAQLQIKKYGANSFEVVPAVALPPGQYAFVTNVMMADCFEVDAGMSGAPAATGATAAPAAPPPPPGWKLHPLSANDGGAGQEVSLMGKAQSGSQSGAAVLRLSCRAAQNASDGQPTSNLVGELRVRRGTVTFTTGAYGCEGDTDKGNALVHSQIGAEEQPQMDVCYDSELPQEPNTPVDFQIASNDDADWMHKVLAATGSTVKIQMHASDISPDALNAQFDLPTDASTANSALSSCFAAIDIAVKQREEKIVAECPEVPGKTLTVDVLTGAALKKLPPDSENDIGVAWELPKISKAHPVRPKLSMACSYEESSGQGAAGKERKLIPIPATATFCALRFDGRLKRYRGTCSKG